MATIQTFIQTAASPQWSGRGSAMNLDELNSDVQMLQKLAAGDLDDTVNAEGEVISQGALSELFRAAYARLFDRFLRYQIDYADVDDVIQEFMLHVRRALLKGMYQYNQDSSFSAWLFRAATNFALNYKYKVKRVGRKLKTVSFAELDFCFSQAGEPGDSVDFLERYVPPNFSMLSAINPLLEEDKEVEVEDEDSLRRGRLALYLIDENYRKFLLLYFGEGLGYKKILKSEEIRNKNGKPVSKTTIVYMGPKAVLQFCIAYVIIGMLEGSS